MVKDLHGAQQVNLNLGRTLVRAFSDVNGAFATREIHSDNNGSVGGSTASPEWGITAKLNRQGPGVGR